MSAWFNEYHHRTSFHSIHCIVRAEYLWKPKPSLWYLFLESLSPLSVSTRRDSQFLFRSGLHKRSYTIVPLKNRLSIQDAMRSYKSIETPAGLSNRQPRLNSIFRKTLEKIQHRFLRRELLFLPPRNYFPSIAIKIVVKWNKTRRVEMNSRGRRKLLDPRPEINQRV